MKRTRWLSINSGVPLSQGARTLRATAESSSEGDVPHAVRTRNTCGRLATDALRGPQRRTLDPRSPSPPGRGGPAVTRRVQGPTDPPNQRRSPSWAPLPRRRVAARGYHDESALPAVACSRRRVLIVTGRGRRTCRGDLGHLVALHESPSDCFFPYSSPLR